MAFDIDASIRFYNKDEDKTLSPGDKFTYYGPKEKAGEIKQISKGLGIGIETIYSGDLVK
jgi:hypothetical protein